MNIKNWELNIVLIMRSSKIIYQLIVEGVQTVAVDQLGRKLSEAEIVNIKDAIAENIPWFDAIAYAIRSKLSAQTEDF